MDDFDGKTVTDSWYNEYKNYVYGLEEQNLNVTHFSQIVWHDTKEFGIYFHTKKGQTFVVARYFPPGNNKGQFTLNVKPPISKMSHIIHDENSEKREQDDQKGEQSRILQNDEKTPKNKELISTGIKLQN